MNPKCLQKNGRLSRYGFCCGHNETAQDGIICLHFFQGENFYAITRNYNHELGEKISITKYQSEAYKIFNSWKKNKEI
jgi:hypothetical protein